MSIVKPCPYDINGEHCKYEIYYGEPIFSKCKNCSRTRTIFKRCIEMTDEEMAEEYCNEEVPFDTTESGEKLYTENDLKQAYLAGLKAGSQLDKVWHDYDAGEDCYEDTHEGKWVKREDIKPKWHKVADGDLPPTSGEMHAERYPILACTKNGYVTVAIRRKHGRAYEWFCSDYDGNTLYLDKEVIAWCEIPKYTEE